MAQRPLGKIQSEGAAKYEFPFPLNQGTGKRIQAAVIGLDAKIVPATKDLRFFVPVKILHQKGGNRGDLQLTWKGDKDKLTPVVPEVSGFQCVHFQQFGSLQHLLSEDCLDRLSGKRAVAEIFFL